MTGDSNSVAQDLRGIGLVWYRSVAREKKLRIVFLSIGLFYIKGLMVKIEISKPFIH